MNKSIREAVYDKYYGKCAYCGKAIVRQDMQVDHIIPKRMNGADAITNYNPSCRRCNHYKRGGDVEYLRDLLLTLHKRLENIYIVRVAIDYGLITISKFDGVFYFEKDN